MDSGRGGNGASISSEGERYVRTNDRAKESVSGGSRSREKLFLVRLREERQAAFLRRKPQGNGFYAGEVRRHGGQDSLFLRLQAHEEPTALRREPRQAVGLI